MQRGLPAIPEALVNYNGNHYRVCVPLPLIGVGLLYAEEQTSSSAALIFLFRNIGI